MEDATLRAFQRLLQQGRVAALGTLHEGEPFVSMVPYVLAPQGPGLVFHISTLASHTRDLQAHGGCSLMVMDTPGPDTFVQALPRATLLGQARPLERDGPEDTTARAAYLARFPQAAPMFALGDFSLWCFEPTQARFVAGFGRAHSLGGAALVQGWPPHG